ncbi:YkvA family protein [Halobacillus salinarum]|uniref:YkvA family protein n=1 Tax=Halobacillus salinarum TaxID=2932257 RepID=A0ABY4ENA7_9BACI|nr:YkvA family protein [Halobacillus salinarum]UOQ45628.1 YkvA family protein [Halobacillus salinarum]
MEKQKKKKAKKLYYKMKDRAEELIRNPQQTKDMIDAARKKSERNKGPLSNVWKEIHLMFSLIREWRNGSYTKVPTGSIVAIVGAILYFISPIDAIPDFIPVAGFLDDIYIVKLVINQVESDLQNYRSWLGEQERTIEDETPRKASGD